VQAQLEHADVDMLPGPHTMQRVRTGGATEPGVSAGEFPGTHRMQGLRPGGATEPAVTAEIPRTRRMQGVEPGTMAPEPGQKVLVDAAALQRLEEAVGVFKEAAAARRGSHKAAIKARSAALVAMIKHHPDWTPEQLRDALDITLPHTM
jgi:hypothetical protein